MLCIGESLEEAKAQLRANGAKEWAEKMETVFRVMDHKINTKDGLKVPSAKEIEDVIISLSDSLTDKYTSIMCGGIFLHVLEETDINFVEIEILYSPPLYE